MKKSGWIMALLVAMNMSAVSQTVGASGPYTFTILKEHAAGAVENQCQTGTCWSFATVSFMEAEILRKGGKSIDISEMYNVRVMYPRKADAFVRYQGKQQFGPGGLSHDVLRTIAEFGIMPESAYSGLQNGATEYNEYNGKKYTPAQFRDELKINPADYVSLTSFTHHPYYAPFVLEVPDNWAKGSFYNVPLQDLEKITNYAIDNGFTIAWDADVSEKGFSHTIGAAILPASEPKKDEWWTALHTELIPTPELRQAAFDSFETTDDHLMHIVGRSKDQQGNLYFITKNSWGASNVFKGYLHVSDNYYLMKTVGIVVHKDALPADIRTKLGLK